MQEISDAYAILCFSLSMLASGPNASPLHRFGHFAGRHREVDLSDLIQLEFDAVCSPEVTHFRRASIL